MIGRPLDALPIDRLIRRVKIASASILVAGGGATGWTSQAAEPGSARYVVRAPYGDVDLRINGDAWAPEVFRVAVGNEPVEVELRARARPGFHLRLLDGNAAVPLGPETLITITDLASGAVSHRRGIFGGRAWIPVDAPGRYRVAVAELEGYRPIPVGEVQVTWRGPNELDVALRRVR